MRNLLIFSLAGLLAHSVPADVVLGSMSTLRWTGAGADLTAAWGPPPPGTVWTGAGLDTLLGTGANWDTGAPPAFDGAESVSFGAGGSKATVAGVARFLDVTFNRDADFTLADGGGTLTVGAGGITAVPLGASPRVYTVGAPVSLLSGAFLRVSGASSLTLTGGVSAAGNLTLEAGTNATLAVSGLPFAAASRTLTVIGGGTVAFGAPGNTWGTLEIGGTTVRTDAPNVFPPGSLLYMGRSGAFDATVDLNGHDQTVARLLRRIVSAKDCLITSAEPATLTVNQPSGSYFYNGGFGGAVSLVKTGGGTLNIYGTNITMTGSCTVSNGTLYILYANTFAPPATFSISSPGKLQVARDLTETVGELVLDGVKQGSGTYGSTTSQAEHKSKHFTGTGMVLVP